MSKYPKVEYSFALDGLVNSTEDLNFQFYIIRSASFNYKKLWDSLIEMKVLWKYNFILENNIFTDLLLNCSKREEIRGALLWLK